MSLNPVKTFVSKIKTLAKKIKRSSKKLLVNKPAKIILIVVLVGSVGYGVFWAGEQHGADKQKKKDEKTHLPFSGQQSSNASRPGPNQSRFSVIGTITKVSDSSLEIKSQNTTTIIGIDKNTTITNKKGEKQDLSALKKDQKVIVSGMTKSDKSQTAERVRIQS